MFQAFKTLTSTIANAAAGKLKVFVNEAGEVATKDEAGVVKVLTEAALPTTHAKSVSGSYPCNGSSMSIDLGFKPDFVLVKISGQIAVFANRTSMFKRTDALTNVASSAGSTLITFTGRGFSVGSGDAVNLAGATAYYFAFTDNGSKSLLQGNWQGNSVAGRTVDIFSGTPLQGAIIKKDSNQAPVWVLADEASNYFYNGAANAVSSGTALAGATGILTLGSGTEVNNWSGILGEGVNCLAIPLNSESAYVKKYVGTTADKTIVLPFEPEALILVSRNTASPAARLWMSSFPTNNAADLTSGALGTGVISSVVGNVLTLTGASALNTNGNEFAVYAFRKLDQGAVVPENIYPTSQRKTVVVQPTGYIDCGTSNTLSISGPISMEWYGAITAIDAVQYATNISTTVGATQNDLAANQDKIIPLLFRSGGVDNANGNVSFGIAVTAPPVSTDTWDSPVLLINTQDNWRMVEATSGNDSSGAAVSLDRHPFNTGYAIEVGKLYHIIATTSGSGVWSVYVNGVNIKERKRDLTAAIGRPNVQGFSGHRTMIGARQRDTIANANGLAFKLARLYSKALTAKEVKQNYLSLFGTGSKVSSGLVEEWSAENASGTTLTATISSVNNGTITNGIVG